MIDRTISQALQVADIAPKAVTKLADGGGGKGAFSEALAGAHTVHDRRESHASPTSRRDWARTDHSADRTRGQERAAEVRSDRAGRADRDEAAGSVEAGVEVDVRVDAQVDTDAAGDARAQAAVTTGAAADAAVEVAGDVAAAATAAADDAALAAEVAADVTAEAQVGGIGLALGAIVDLDAIISPTVTNVAHATTLAVDAAMKLAVEAEAAVAVDAAVTIEAEAQLAATLAQGAEDAETGDVEAGPTRPTTPVPATTSGPSPVQAAATAEVDVSVDVDVDIDVATSTASAIKAAANAAASVTAAASASVEVAAGTATDATAQLVQSAAVELDGSVEATVDIDGVAVPTKAVTADAEVSLDVDVEADADLALATNGRASAAANQNPAASLQVQAHAQAQAKAAEAAAEEGGETTAPKLEPLPSQANPTATAARDAQVSAGVRIREGILGGAVQERIDHIAEQLATRLRLSHAAGGSQVQLSLKPRELGEVTVQMNVRDGLVAATILVDKADTLRTMQTNIEELKRSLEGQGLTVQEFSVDVRGEAGAGGANARAAAELRQQAARTSGGSAASVAGAANVIPGLSGDIEVDVDATHDGDVSVLA